MARPTLPAPRAELVSGNLEGKVEASALAASAALYRNNKRTRPAVDKHQIAKPWQIEAYRHVNICGEARYAATLYAASASKAEIGVSQPQSLTDKAVWISEGPEVDAFAELAPTVRERSKLIWDYMVHRQIAGECFLIARERVETDPGYEDTSPLDLNDMQLNGAHISDLNNPIWEIVAVTELRRHGDKWEVRHDNGEYLQLAPDDPVIRMWWPDPENRREAWSPFRSLLPTLREIEYFTHHIFAQVRSRLMSAGVWFLPDNLTFPPPPPDAVDGGEEAIAAMNEAEQFMMSLAASSMALLDKDEVAFPSIVMAAPEALENIDQAKLIQFWSEIDEAAMRLRSDSIRRFALGVDMPPERLLGLSGIAVTGAAGSAGSVNHWSAWSLEEQTISEHVEPGLDALVSVLTTSFLRPAVPGTDKVIAYDTARLRLRQDRSKEALEWYDRGVLSAEVALRETGFDPDSDRMSNDEFKRWVLTRVASGSATPLQVEAALTLLGVTLDSGEAARELGAAPQLPDSANPSLDDHPYEGPPREDHYHNPAPYSARTAACEVLVLRALEKAGNRLLNDGKRGRDKDRTTPPHTAHVLKQPAQEMCRDDFDFGLAPLTLVELPDGSHVTGAELEATVNKLGEFCARLYNERQPYDRADLQKLLED